MPEVGREDVGYRDNYQPGDLSVRFKFNRTIGNGLDVGKVTPSVEITDQTSGLSIEFELTAEQLTKLFAGSAAEISADKVEGFKDIKNWGKRLKIAQRYVQIESGSWPRDSRKLPHVAKVIAELESEGYGCDKPYRNNAGKWVITGRRYDDQPE